MLIEVIKGVVAAVVNITARVQRNKNPRFRKRCARAQWDSASRASFLCALDWASLFTPIVR
jgi:hypothetical protein